MVPYQKIKAGVLSLAASAFLAASLLPAKLFAASGIQGGLRDIESEATESTGSGFVRADSVPELIAEIIKILLMIGGAIAVLFVIIGGYQYLTSGGNEEAAEKGRKTITNALIGVVVVVLAWTIVNVIVNTVD